MRILVGLLLSLFISSLIASEEAKTPKVHVNAAQATSFSPLIMYIQPGDTVKWENMTAHDAQSIEGMIPDGAEPWHVPLGENGSVTLEKSGVYVYKCNPHWAYGMGGAIVVGEAHNMAQLEANAKGRAKGIVIKLKRALAKRSE